MLKPLHSFLLVELPADTGEVELPSGIILPGSASEETNDAVVLQAGPGKEWKDTGERSAVWAEKGDRVIFLQRHFDPLPRGEGEARSRRGFVRDHEVCAQLDAPDFDQINPRNGYLMLIQHAPEEAVGSILTPEEYQRRPRAGTVIALGEGLLQTNGELAALRVEIPDVLGVPESELLGATLFWSAAAEVVELADDHVVSCVLVHAKDILAIEIQETP